jgi:predicted metal-dependent hydrolase
MAQLRLPWGRLSPDRTARELVVDDHRLPIVVRRHRWARRYILRVGADGAVRLTVPTRAPIADGLRFAAEQLPWVADEWRRLQRRATWSAGTAIWYRGTRVALEVERDRITCGDLTIPTRSLQRFDTRHQVQAALRALARTELPARCRELAGAAGFKPLRVTVRDQRSRWGACSGRGAITLNWRLIQMPPSVADYVMWHELAHLQQPNHSRRFWRLVGSLCPTWQLSERWLRRFGAELL